MLDIFGIHVEFNLKDAMDSLERILKEHFPSKADKHEKLIASCRTLDLKSVNSLLKKNVDINEPDEEGRTLLINASSKGDNDSVGEKNFHLVKLLLDCGAELNLEAKDHWGNTALIMASRNGAARIVKALIDAGAEVNAQNGIGWTGLMRAAKHGYPVTVKVLLNHGSDKYISNEDGKTARDIVIENRDAIIRKRGQSVYDELLELLS